MGFLLTVRRTEDGETVEDRMLVERDTREDAVEVGLAAFAEPGHDWTLVDAAEETSSVTEPLRFEPLTADADDLSA